MITLHLLCISENSQTEPEVKAEVLRVAPPLQGKQCNAMFLALRNETCGQRETFVMFKHAFTFFFAYIISFYNFNSYVRMVLGYCLYLL